MHISYFNALAGAGKTHASAHYADRLARRHQKVLFVQPTKHLIDKTIADELEPLDPPYRYRPIHGDADLSRSVVGDIVRHFQTTPRHEGEVLFITHAAFLRLPYVEHKADWVLIMDEVPQVDVFEELNLPDTHHLITPYLSLEPCGPAYGLLMKGTPHEHEEDRPQQAWRRRAQAPWSSREPDRVRALGCLCRPGAI